MNRYHTSQPSHSLHYPQWSPSPYHHNPYGPPPPYPLHSYPHRPPPPPPHHRPHMFSQPTQPPLHEVAQPSAQEDVESIVQSALESCSDDTPLTLSPKHDISQESFDKQRDEMKILQEQLTQVTKTLQLQDEIIKKQETLLHEHTQAMLKMEASLKAQDKVQNQQVLLMMQQAEVIKGHGEKLAQQQQPVTREELQAFSARLDLVRLTIFNDINQFKRVLMQEIVSFIKSNVHKDLQTQIMRDVNKHMDTKIHTLKQTLREIKQTLAQGLPQSDVQTDVQTDVKSPVQTPVQAPMQAPVNVNEDDIPIASLHANKKRKHK